MLHFLFPFWVACYDFVNNLLTNQLAEEKKVMASDQPNATYDSEIDSFRALAGDDNAGLLKSFVDQVVSGVKVDIEPILLSPSSDKSHRTVSLNIFI